MTVNKSQSTNDVFPTAMHISVAKETIFKMLLLKNFGERIKTKSNEFKNIEKLKNTFTRCYSINSWTRVFRISYSSKKH